MRDVAQVHDGHLPQQNVVRLDGIRGVLLTILKSGSASTLDVVRGAKAAAPGIVAGLPPGVEFKAFADQSIFVRSAVDGLLREGLIAAALTAVMILLFLGNWRGTLIIALSIPLSVLSSLAVLSALGESINLMTLGGLALAVGIPPHTTLSVPALMGAIMSLGVATANSVLVVSFARDDLRRGLEPARAAWEAADGPWVRSSCGARSRSRGRRSRPSWKACRGTWTSSRSRTASGSSSPPRASTTFVWSIGPGQRLLTAHVSLGAPMDACAMEAFLSRVKSFLRERWDIDHATLEPEVLGCASGDLLGRWGAPPPAATHTPS